ncbi:MAG: aspartate--tRNA(Asn) ligase [Candidatus Colwellbacteria bacterium]|nr:aspartate--tRNA(Asn) ligase [Candidatus Colwellbacteria bacterium]
MRRVYVSDIKDYIGKKVKVDGFAQIIRDQGNIKFIVLRDITGIIQIVVHKKNKEAMAVADGLTHESVVEIEGLAKEEKQAPGGFEVSAEKIKILSLSNAELPIPIIEKGKQEEAEAPKRLDYRWLDLRKPEKAKIFRVWTEFEKGIRDYFLKNNFIQIYTPSLMNTASESGAEVFEVKYFDRKAYLAQSPQFYKQMAMAAGLERVFMIGPVFRAEPSFTTRHMTEFTGWDFEMAYIDSHHDLMDAEEGMIIEGFKAVAKEFPELNLGIPAKPFPRIAMVDAKKILAKENMPSGEEHDLSPEEEKKISEYVSREHNHDFVFITDYHKSKSAFYHMRHEDDKDRSKRADLIYKGLEVTTLAQREHRIEILEKQAKEKGMNLNSLKNYLNFFRWGCPPHGGAGIGPGRFIMKILDLPNVREATYLPRDVKRLEP